MTEDDALNWFRLRALALATELGNVRAACRAMGIHPSTFYRWAAPAPLRGPAVQGLTALDAVSPSAQQSGFASEEGMSLTRGPWFEPSDGPNPRPPPRAVYRVPILTRGGPAMRPHWLFGTRVEEHDGVAVMALRGELDMATASILREDLARIEDRAGTIMLDLREVTFIDSSGLMAFLEARSRAQDNGHRLLVSGASPAAQRLFELTGTRFLLDEHGVPGAQETRLRSAAGQIRRSNERRQGLAL